MGMSLLASNKGKTYATVGVVTQIVILTVNFLFCPYYGVYVFPVSLGTVHLVAGAIMFSQVSYIENKKVLRYLFRALLTVSGITALFYTLNGIIDYKVSFIRLVAIGIIFAALLPASAWMLGFNVKAYFIKVKTKFNHFI